MNYARMTAVPPEPAGTFTDEKGPRQAVHSPPGQAAAGPQAARSVRLTGDSLISIADVRKIFGLGRTAAYELTRRPGFPDPVPVSARCYRWWASEVDAFATALRCERARPAALALRFADTEILPHRVSLRHLRKLASHPCQPLSLQSAKKISPQFFTAVYQEDFPGMNEHDRALLLSVRPRCARAILDGSKTAEIRRQRPAVQPGTLVIIYATKPVGALVGTAHTRESPAEIPPTCGNSTTKAPG